MVIRLQALAFDYTSLVMLIFSAAFPFACYTNRRCSRQVPNKLYWRSTLQNKGNGSLSTEMGLDSETGVLLLVPIAHVVIEELNNNARQALLKIQQKCSTL